MSAQSNEPSPAERIRTASSLSAKSLPVSRSNATSAPVLKRPVPAASVAKAKKAFNNFSLSKFPNGGTSSNYVNSGQSVSAVQRQGQINQLKSLDASGRRLRVALSDSDLKQLLPSFDGKTVALTDLMDVIQKKMRGTEFYVAGNPTLARLAVQSQVNDIISAIQSGSNSKPE